MSFKSPHLLFPLVWMIFLAVAGGFAGCGDQQAGENSSAGIQDISPDHTADSLKYIQLGSELSSQAQQLLGARLKAALSRGGVPEAVPYCNTVALPLMDSLSTESGAVISRIALRHRNAQNAAKGRERDYFESLVAKHQAGEAVMPEVQFREDGSAVYYSPIMLAPLCTQCHGNVGTEIKEENYELITSLYPGDEATGFAPGDLRGLWKVEFNSPN